MTNKRKNHAIILAAGRGSRFGGNILKQFVRINGKPMLHYSLETFLNHDGIDSVTVVLPKNYKDFPLPRHEKLRPSVTGGVERYHSTIRALTSLESDGDDGILIHDAARPLVPSTIIGDVCAALDEADLVIPTIEVSDALIDTKHLYIIDRECYAALQTPQGFRSEPLRRSMTQLELRDMSKWRAPSCEFEIVRLLQPTAKVKMIPGHVQSFKVTYDNDLCRM